MRGWLTTHTPPANQRLWFVLSAETLAYYESPEMCDAAEPLGMLGIDEMERLKGLPLKLLAYEQLLRTRPEIERRVALVQVAIKARNYTPAAEEDYDAVRSEVTRDRSEPSPAFSRLLSTTHI